ncbi:MAG: ADP-ribosylglycohydrolase family protein [Clostridiales bacterium]|nr:ADP-ribosylglycohydrolase family protein [Clostridiales bacterium]
MDEKRLGGLYGLLIGDALGVPYEFKAANEIPEFDQIDMIPPKGYPRTYPQVSVGTWSDDGAQALCLLSSLIEKGHLDINDLASKLSDWMLDGYMTPDDERFDIGIQTRAALMSFCSGTPADKSGQVNPQGQGNGSLMRTLPLALWHKGTDKELALDAHAQSLPTHGHVVNQVCCAVYCLTARRLIEGMEIRAAVDDAVNTLKGIYSQLDEEYEKRLLKLKLEEDFYGEGTGYVVDCLKSAFMILTKAESYEQAVKLAVALGSDTDTTACVAGGLAGIKFGLSGIPERWLSLLRGKQLIENIISRW